MTNLFEDKLYKIISKSIKNYEKNFSDEELTALTGDFIYLKSRKDPKYLHEWIDMCTKKIKELDNKIYDALLKMREEIMDAYKFEDLEKIYIKPNSESLKYIAQWDDEKSDIVLKAIKDEDFYKKKGRK